MPKPGESRQTTQTATVLSCLAVSLADRRLIADPDSRWLGCQDDASPQDNAKCRSGDQQRESKDTGERERDRNRRKDLVRNTSLFFWFTAHKHLLLWLLHPQQGRCVFVYVCVRSYTVEYCFMDRFLVSERCVISYFVFFLDKLRNKKQEKYKKHWKTLMKIPFYEWFKLQVT